jgi:hypothetical protein
MAGPTNRPGSAETKGVTFVRDLVLWLTSNRAAVVHFIRYLQIVVGLILLGSGWYMGHSHFHLIREGKRAQGRVVAYHQEYFQRSATSTFRSVGYMPVVEYWLDDRVVRFQDWLGNSRAGEVNIPVTVLYDTAKPSVAMIDRPVWNWLPWAPILGVGLLLLLIGVAGVVRPRA